MLRGEWWNAPLLAQVTLGSNPQCKFDPQQQVSSCRQRLYHPPRFCDLFVICEFVIYDLRICEFVFANPELK